VTPRFLSHNPGRALAEIIAISPNGFVLPFCRSAKIARCCAEKNRAKKYRRFTGRGCAQNTGKAIEISKQKARAPNRRITGAKNRKNRAGKQEEQGYRLVAPVSDWRIPGFLSRHQNQSGNAGNDEIMCFAVTWRVKRKTRPKRWGCGRANVTLHLLPCTPRAENASGIQSLPAIQ
jgi:hypothetical protein